MSPVAAGGGGTGVLAGPHRLVERAVAASRSGDAGHSPALRKALAAAHPWLRDLRSRPAGGDRIARFMRDGAVLDGVGLRVVELTGAAGDAAVFGVARYAPVLRRRLLVTTAPVVQSGQDAEPVTRRGQQGDDVTTVPPEEREAAPIEGEHPAAPRELAHPDDAGVGETNALVAQE